ncbi:PHP domain-containing protein [Fervidicella metallireducens]|uniref:PHP domain-containing protein n=1 Tax=Fervidicella metallireducens TaxID=655338 RepID=UPI001A9A15B4|nr:PHP domain-containing protein [Fervidicella metallireducens]
MDFHIHSALSPCGDNDMTPNNIINMAKLKGLDAIAITDHNSCENVAACVEVGIKNNIIVIPGMELQTKEDVHSLCLFKSVEDAMEFQNYVYSNLTYKLNKHDVFGQQLICDINDEIVGINERMLLLSSEISFDDAFYSVKELGGVFIPAHVDRDSYSVITSLGFIPDYLGIKCLEYNSEQKLRNLISSGIIKDNYKFIQSSDAHYLQDILESVFSIEVSEYSVKSILNYLNN